MKEINIDGTIYVAKSSLQQDAKKKKGMQYVLIRADRAGVFTGYLEEENGTEVILCECRRIWYWDGAASISQISIDGVSKPDNCKFPQAVERQKIKGVIEIIPCTEKARKSIEAVKNWQYEK